MIRERRLRREGTTSSLGRTREKRFRAECFREFEQQHINIYYEFLNNGDDVFACERKMRSSICTHWEY